MRYALRMRGKNSASGAMPPVLALPPAIQKMSSKEESARAAASALVALELLTKRTRPLRPTSSMRCASPGKLLSALAIFSAGSPSAVAAASAAPAFCALWTPRRRPMPASGMVNRASPASAMTMESPSR